MACPKTRRCTSFWVAQRFTAAIPGSSPTPALAAEENAFAPVEALKGRDFRVCVRAYFVIIEWNGPCENQAPEGAAQVSPARQRWESGKKDSSPGGTAEFSHRLFSPAIIQVKCLTAHLKARPFKAEIAEWN